MMANKVYADARSALEGALFEGMVYGLLRAYRDLGRLEAESITYWAPADAQQTEVDFLVSREDEHVAIEVKAGGVFRQEHTKGLRAIADLEGLRRRILVYGGDSAQRTAEGIEVWPFARFAEELDAGRLRFGDERARLTEVVVEQGELGP